MRRTADLLIVAGLLAVTTVVALLPRTADVETGQTRRFKYLMGTSMRIEVYGGDRAARDQAADEAFAAIDDVDRVMSAYRSDTELTMVNRTAGMRPVVVSPPLFAVLAAAERVSRASGGAFDITIPTGTTTQWRLDADAHSVRFARPDVRLELGGMAKGFAVELAAASLRRGGFSGVIDAGGTQFLVGHPIGKATWSLGIGDPDRRDRLLGAVDLDEGAVSTVPGAGEPTLSVTVTSPDGTLCGALARAVSAMRPADGLALLDSFPHTWGVMALRRTDGAVDVVVSAKHRASFHPVGPSGGVATVRVQ